MKKITFILFALIAGTAFGQSKSAEASTFAEIVEPLTISKTNDLNFGRIIGGAAGGGEVTIAATSEGNRTIDDDLNAPGGTISSASFDITGSSYGYSITMVATDLSSEGGTAMSLVPVSSFTDNKSSGEQTLYVGGTLTVGTTQNAGLYEGTVEVTVTYE